MQSLLASKEQKTYNINKRWLELSLFEPLANVYLFGNLDNKFNQY